MLDGLPVGWKLTLLGVIQGLAEFLPISSSGHLVLAEHFFGLHEDELALVVWLHLGTLVATLAVYWREVLAILRGDWRLALAIFVAMIPAAIVGWTCREFFKDTFASVTAVGFFFWVTAAALIAGERLFRACAVEREQIKLTDAIVIGVAQAIAILPGVSRSGMTISAGLACGLRREAAARFSFLLAIPTVAGAVLVEGYEVIQSGAPAYDPAYIAAGTLTAFLVGFLSLKGLIALLRRYPMYAFAGYCVLLGASVLIYRLLAPHGG